MGWFSDVQRYNGSPFGCPISLMFWCLPWVAVAGLAWFLRKEANS